MSEQPPQPPAPPAANAPAAAPKPATMSVEMPAGLEPIYSNTTIIAHSPSEIIMDFARILPNFPKARVTARVVMTPLNAKLLLRALGENLTKFEAVYGEIRLPEGHSLADHLFKPPK